MSSSISRFLVLAFARLTNYAILLVSPIVFVRILDQHAYGQYREFVVYALALATVVVLTKSWARTKGTPSGTSSPGTNTPYRDGIFRIDQVSQ